MNSPTPASQAATEQCSRYTRVAKVLALEALDAACDASPHRPQRGQTRLSMTLSLPAARLMMGPVDDKTGSELYAGVARAIGALADASRGLSDGQAPILTDGVGHTREVYHPFVVHQILTALAMHRESILPLLDETLSASGVLRSMPAGLARVETLGASNGEKKDPEHGRPLSRIDRGTLKAKLDGNALALLAQMLEPILHARLIDDELMLGDPPVDWVAGALWRAVCALEWALLVGDMDQGVRAVSLIEAAASMPGKDGALHALGLDDLLDAWTYRELVGLHALFVAGVVARMPAWHIRCRQIAMFHQGHTQPDYTTYQPWALAAFADDEATILFVEQQLHDVRSHLSIEGPGGALMPAMLLAEATLTLAGTMRRAWNAYTFKED